MVSGLSKDCLILFLVLHTLSLLPRLIPLLSFISISTATFTYSSLNRFHHWRCQLRFSYTFYGRSIEPQKLEPGIGTTERILRLCFSFSCIQLGIHSRWFCFYIHLLSYSHVRFFSYFHAHVFNRFHILFLQSVSRLKVPVLS